MKEMSKNNPYYLSPHRKQELRHFCLQYPEWIKAKNDISFIARNSDIHVQSERANIVEDAAIRLESYNEKIRLLQEAAFEADEELASYILLAVTQGKSYENLQLMYNIPTNRVYYTKAQQKFFYILDKIRD